MLEQVTAAVESAFPDLDRNQIQLEMKLGEIPEWDSMKSINLIMELEDRFDVKLTGVMLSAHQTLADVITLLEYRGIRF